MSDGQMPFQQDRDDSPPVDEGEQTYQEVESFGDEGDPMIRVDGYVIFVTDLLTEEKPVIGDEIAVEITNTGPKFGFGKEVQ